jgi:hypothetical protein
MGEGIFVFVVCGDKEHIDTLNYSLKALKKFSKNEIFVLTDISRNASAIEHSNIVDVKTPEKYNHHQASIFLKTSIHRYFPKGFQYCYLDTDVVALNEKVDEIFNLYHAPVTFGRDHCLMNKFSPSAVNCNCIEQFENWQKELKYLFKKYKHLEREPEQVEKKKILEFKLDDIKKNRLSYAWISFRFWLSPYRFNLDGTFFLDKKKEVWVDKHGKAVLYENEDNAISQIENTTDFRCDIENNHTWTIFDKEVFDCKCNHLQEAIKDTFDINVSENDWQHWNGGVFLFDEKSEDFLESWHDKTNYIFTLENWKTRDQGTLIATAYEFGLNNHFTLPSEFNFIADYEHDKIQHQGKLHFSFENSQEIIKPNFIHVYHHWGDDSWEVWREVENVTGFYMDKERQFFNALWIGEKLSKLELLTIHSFLSQGHRFRLWVYDKLETPLPDGVILANANEIIPKEKVFAYRNSNAYGHGKGSYAGFSDIFRYKLLYERGGWWTDMDITCLKNIYTDKPFFFRPHHELKVVGNVMKCPKRSDLMKRCYEEAILAVDEDNVDWHKPIQILNDNISKLKLEKYISGHLSNNDRWHETSRLVWYEDELPENWLFIHWQNEEWRSKSISKTDFYFQSTLATLLSKYGLINIPSDNWSLLYNKVKYHEWLRKFLN